MTFKRLTFEEYLALPDKKKLIYDYDAYVEEIRLNKLGKELGSQYDIHITEKKENDKRPIHYHPFIDDINNIEYLEKIYNNPLVTNWDI